MKKWKSYLLFVSILAVTIVKKLGEVDWWMLG